MYVDLPDEDSEPGVCGRLMQSMYGTRDAAQNWEMDHTRFMEEVGFVRGIASPCVFYNPDRDIQAAIHGDDFTLLGTPEGLDWFRARISAKYSATFRGRLGPRASEQTSIRILNRIVHWKRDAIEYEADQRHAELTTRQLGLNDRTNSVVTP